MSAPATPSPTRTAMGRTHRRAVIVGSASAALLVAVGLVTMTVGDYPLSLSETLQTLFGGGSQRDQYIIFEVRLPRLLMAVLCGVGLGSSGAIMQALLRNPLASPELLGITGGASVAAVAGTLMFGLGGLALVGLAFAGGLVIAAVLLVAAAREGSSSYRIVLAGVGIAFVCVSVVGYLMKRAQLNEAQMALRWITGSIDATAWSDVLVLGAVLVIALPLAAIAGAEPAAARARRRPGRGARGLRAAIPHWAARHRGAHGRNRYRIRRPDRLRSAVGTGDRPRTRGSRLDRHHRIRSARRRTARRVRHRRAACAGPGGSGRRRHRNGRRPLSSVAARTSERTPIMTDAPVLRAEGLSTGYPGVRISDGLNLEIRPGSFTALVGANGSGKSTLLSTLARILPAHGGRVLLDDVDVHRMNRKAFARTVGMLPQHPSAPEGITVAELAARGRYPTEGCSADSGPTMRRPSTRLWQSPA